MLDTYLTLMSYLLELNMTQGRANYLLKLLIMSY